MIRVLESFTLIDMERVFDRIKTDQKNVYLIKWKTPSTRMKVVKVKKIHIVESSNSFYIKANDQEFDILFKEVMDAQIGRSFVSITTKKMDMIVFFK